MSLLRNQGPWKASENRLRRLNSENLWFNPGGQLWAWGYNSYNELGQGDAVHRSAPVQIPGNDWKQLAFQGGNNHAQLAIKSDDSLWGWGYNLYGTLGLNDTIQRNRPVQSNVSGPWKKLVLSNYTVHGLRPDKTLWAWGYNGYGNLGLNETAPRSSPIQIPGEWSDIGMTYYASCGIKSDGTLWGWGYNPYGTLGLNDIVSRSSPVQVGTRSDWRKVFTTKYYVAAAVTNDGSFYNWGYNSYGSLGLNDGIYRSSPVILLGNAGIELFDHGTYHNSAAVKSDGSLFVWGYGPYGNNGQNEVATRSNPIQIAGGEWMQPTCSYDTSAIKEDGSHWAWGYNNYGTYGNNIGAAPYRSSPVNMTSGWKTYRYVSQNGIDLHDSPVAVSGIYHRWVLSEPSV